LIDDKWYYTRRFIMKIFSFCFVSRFRLAIRLHLIVITDVLASFDLLRTVDIHFSDISTRLSIRCPFQARASEQVGAVDSLSLFTVPAILIVRVCVLASCERCKTKVNDGARVMHVHCPLNSLSRSEHIPLI
jgi:hypothetical protein